MSSKSRRSSRKRKTITEVGVSMNDLPVELIYQIALYLRINDILQKCRTSKVFNDICKDRVFWRDYARIHNINTEWIVFDDPNLGRSILSLFNQQIVVPWMNRYMTFYGYDVLIYIQLTTRATPQQTGQFETLMNVDNPFPTLAKRVEVTYDEITKKFIVHYTFKFDNYRITVEDVVEFIGMVKDALVTVGLHSDSLI
jgi:hypothetical protein